MFLGSVAVARPLVLSGSVVALVILLKHGGRGHGCIGWGHIDLEGDLLKAVAIDTPQAFIKRDIRVSR